MYIFGLLCAYLYTCFFDVVNHLACMQYKKLDKKKRAEREYVYKNHRQGMCCLMCIVYSQIIEEKYPVALWSEFVIGFHTRKITAFLPQMGIYRGSKCLHLKTTRNLSIK
jgi:hypothetical protein